MIFVDAGAWYANAIKDDDNSAAARQWFDSHSTRLITSDYVVDETLTLLKSRRHMAAALRLGEMFFAGKLADIVMVTEVDIIEAWETFRGYRDKDWSFTDCTSKVLMARLGITTAFSFDAHFRQFGTVTVVP